MIVICAGTRPEFIKLAPIMLELDKRKIDYLFIDTWQHHDPQMNDQFINELGLKKPDLRINLAKNKRESECQFLYGTMQDLWIQLAELKLGKDDVILVEGDTTSTLACTLYANKEKIPLAHVEAGLRSHDPRMPEEYNRRATDHLSTYLFAPTTLSRVNLERESVMGTIFVTGNTIIDALNLFLDKAITPKHNPFILATFHRQENVDNPKVLEAFLHTCKDAPLPVIYPLHHRTKRRIKESGCEIPANLNVTDVVGYFEFLGLLKACRLVLTDSGGLQEEVTHPKIRKPCVVMRESTERQEAEILGFTKVVGTKKKRVLDAIHNCLRHPKSLPTESPYGDGSASRQIVNILT